MNNLSCFEDKTYVGTFHNALTNRLLFSVRIRYFSQMHFGYGGGERVLVNTLRTIGPTTGVKASVGERTMLSIDGWYERQTQTGQSARTLSTMVMFLNVRI